MKKSMFILAAVLVLVVIVIGPAKKWLKSNQIRNQIQSAETVAEVRSVIKANSGEEIHKYLKAMAKVRIEKIDHQDAQKLAYKNPTTSKEWEDIAQLARKGSNLNTNAGAMSNKLRHEEALALSSLAEKSNSSRDLWQEISLKAFPGSNLDILASQKLAEMNEALAIKRFNEAKTAKDFWLVYTVYTSRGTEIYKKALWKFLTTQSELIAQTSPEMMDILLKAGNDEGLTNEEMNKYWGQFDPEVMGNYHRIINWLFRLDK